MLLEPIGIVATPLSAIVIAPSELRSLPSMVLLAPRLTAPGCANKDPFIALFVATEMAP